jgi:hypothetical protein
MIYRLLQFVLHWVNTCAFCYCVCIPFIKLYLLNGFVRDIFKKIELAHINPAALPNCSKLRFAKICQAFSDYYQLFIKFNVALAFQSFYSSDLRFKTFTYQTHGEHFHNKIRLDS